VERPALIGQRRRGKRWRHSIQRQQPEAIRALLRVINRYVGNLPPITGWLKPESRLRTFDSFAEYAPGAEP
jgi:hypothetical protein